MIPKSEVKEGQMRKERGSKSSGILGASWAIGSSFSPDPAVKFGQYVVMLKLSWAMLNRVEAICQICSAMLLALHPKTLSPSRTRILSELLRTILAPSGGRVQPSRCHGDTNSALLKAIQKHTSKTLPPVALQPSKNQRSNHPKTQKLLQNALPSGPAAQP